MARRKGRRRSRRGSHEHIKTISPITYMNRRSKDSLVFVPRIPSSLDLPMAMVKALFTQGVLSPSDPDVNSAPTFKFSDSTTFAHIHNMMKLFKLRVKTAKVNAALGIIVAFLMCLRAVFGDKGAFVLWVSLFEAVLTGTEVKMLDSKEAVASMTRVKDDRSPGWDLYYADFHKAILQLLERRQDRKERERMTMMAAAMPGDSYLRRIMLDHFKLTNQHMLVRPTGLGDATPVGERSAHTEMVDSPIAQLLARANPHLLAPPQHRPSHGDPTAGWAGFGESIYRNDTAITWGSKMERLLNTQIGRLPAMPVDGLQERQIHHVQQYGAVRETHSGEQHKHTGLDIGGRVGDPIKAMYDGEVVELVKNWKPGEGAGGNLIRLRSKSAEPGIYLDHGYYHLDKVERGLAVGSPVMQGQKIGEMGSTGNSKGPHLHLGTTWKVRDEKDTQAGPHGVTLFKEQLDPQLVIERGAVHAARISGAPIIERSPDLAQGAWVLSSIGAESYNQPVYGDFLGLFSGVARAAQDIVEGAGRAIASVAPEQARAVNDFSREVNDFSRQWVLPVVEWAMNPNGFIRFTITQALGTAGVPTDQVNAILDAMVSSMRVALEAGDAVESFLSRLKADPRVGGLSPEQQKAALDQARNAYNTVSAQLASGSPFPGGPGGGDDWGDDFGDPDDDWDDDFGDPDDDDWDDDDEVLDEDFSDD